MIEALGFPLMKSALLTGLGAFVVVLSVELITDGGGTSGPRLVKKIAIAIMAKPLTMAMGIAGEVDLVDGSIKMNYTSTYS